MKPETNDNDDQADSNKLDSLLIENQKLKEKYKQKRQTLMDIQLDYQQLKLLLAKLLNKFPLFYIEKKK